MIATRTIAALILLLVVSADHTPPVFLHSHLAMNHDNRRCQFIGRQAERDGVISEREARRIARWDCKKTGGVWVSARFYQA